MTPGRVQAQEVQGGCQLSVCVKRQARRLSCPLSHPRFSVGVMCYQLFAHKTPQWEAFEATRSEGGFNEVGAHGAGGGV